jgi:transposase
VRKGVVEDISHEGLRALLREEGVSFQAIKTWKESNDPDFELKKNRILELYDLADGKVQAGPGDPDVVICYDEFSPHLSTKKDTRVGDWARANNVELAYSPHYASWLNRIEAQFTALRYFCLDGTDHQSHEAQAFLIRRYIAWRNRNAQNKALRELVKRANVA